MRTLHLASDTRELQLSASPSNESQSENKPNQFYDFSAGDFATDDRFDTRSAEEYIDQTRLAKASHDDREGNHWHDGMNTIDVDPKIRDFRNRLVYRARFR